MTDTAAIESERGHRPFPMPRVPWVLFQSWQNLLFAHWRLAPERLRPLVPSALELDLFEGEAWVGITPFELRDFRPRGLPAVPMLSDFPELNLRTYVRAGGRPGIYFFSLDAGSALAVAGARIGFRLPYRSASMSVDDAGGTEGMDARIRFVSERDGGEARFQAEYGPTGPVFQPGAGTLEHFLVERYALFTTLRNGDVLQAVIHHRPWSLQPAEAEIRENRLADAEGVPLGDQPPLLHFSRRQDTLIWPPMTVDDTVGPRARG